MSTPEPDHFLSNLPAGGGLLKISWEETAAFEVEIRRDRKHSPGIWRGRKRISMEWQLRRLETRLPAVGVRSRVRRPWMDAMSG